MGSLDATSTHRVSVLFGPKYPEVQLSTSHIRRYLSESPASRLFINVVEDLPSVWSEIVSLWPALRSIAGESQLRQLSLFLQGKAPQETSTNQMNFLLLPVTVLRHMVDLHRLRQEKPEYEITGVQGFCVGYLAAIVACWEMGSPEFLQALGVILRLAVVIGAAVDVDELVKQRAQSIAVRWKSSTEYSSLVETLTGYSGAYIACVTDTTAATVAVWEDQAASVAASLENRGLSVKVMSLYGRFHHSDFIPLTGEIITLCERDDRFRLPGKKPHRRLPRSNIDGTEVDMGSLVSTAVESILARQVNWGQTVSSSLEGVTDWKDLVTIGEGQSVPRSARQRILHTVERDDGDSYGWTDNSVSGCSVNENAAKETTLNGAAVGGTGVNGYAASGDTINSTASSDATISSNGVYRSTVNNGAPASTTFPIAVTGLACRYPQADSVEELWEILDLGHCTVSPMPTDRLKPDQLQREPKGPFWGNYLSRPDAFDHRFFGISAREAESMDPQQRLLLQVAYEAMESAGYCGLRGSKLPEDVGCYVGVGSDDYSENIGSRDATAFSATGTLQAFNSGRISHFFGWTGPSVTIDTACSSAAVAIHLACQALKTNDCSIAVAGGVNVMTDPRWSQNLAAASFLSPTGASRAFDADANGYCRGEGAGILVLRPLDAALKDGDPIYAVITGSAVNQGANCSPITVPDSRSQKDLYMKALSLSKLRPEAVSYVEAHGTGTQVGDPIEYESVRATFGSPYRKEKLYIGSVKDNIGHTETSSGVAGMLKTILMLQKHKIPKQANFSRLNPKIAPSSQIIVPTRTIEWESANRVAMVTNYGAAGSNAAIVVREPSFSATPLTGEHHSRPRLPTTAPFFISAQTEESLRSYCQALQGTIRVAEASDTGAVNDIVYNLARKQNRNMDYFVVFLAASQDSSDVLAYLEDIASGRTKVERQPQTPYPTILCFGGQTGNTANISEDLYECSELLRHYLRECENACQTLNLPSLFPAIFNPLPNKDLVSLHCILFSIQYATAKAWIDSGLPVTRMIGHSFGQLTAVCVAGGLSLLDGMRFISERAKLIRSNWGSVSGVMLSVRASKKQVQALVDAASNSVDIACFNGPDRFVLSGDEIAIQKVEQMSVETGMNIQMKRLDNTHAFHSRLVDRILPGLAEVAGSLNYKPLSISVEACSEAQDDWVFVTREKLVQHSRMPVYFHDAVQRMLSRINGPCAWLEAGSGSPVINMIRRDLDASEPSKGHVYLPIDLRGPQAQGTLAKVTCTLWSKNVPVQFWPFHPSQAGYKWINLPPYQFAKTSHWIDYVPNAFQSPLETTSKEIPGSLVRLLKKRDKECLFGVNTQDPVYRICTAGHAVVDQNLCPASLYFELVMRAATAVSSKGADVSMFRIENLAISAPLVLDMPGDVFVQLALSDQIHDSWVFVLYSREGDRESVNPRHRQNLVVARGIITSPSSSGLKRSAVYHAFRRAVNYADYYHGVDEVYAVGHEAIGRVLLPSSPTKDTSCDPILIDNFIQVAGIHVNCLSEMQDNEVFVCSSVEDVLIGEPFIKRDLVATSPWVVYSNYEREAKRKVMCDIFVMDQKSGALALCITSATFTSVSIQSLKRTLARLSNKPLEKSAQLGQAQPAIHMDVETAGLDSVSISGSAKNTPSGDHGHLQAIQNMLSDLLGVSTGELLADTALGDAGVDSLMSTEVMTETKKRFGVVISSAELAGIPDVRGLVQRIFPGDSGIHSETQSQQPLEIDIAIGEPTLTSTSSSDATTEGDEESGFIDQAGELFAATRRSDEYSRKTQFTGFCNTVYPQQMELVTSYVAEAFQELGVSLASLEPGQQVPHVTVLPQHSKVLKQLYAVLEYSNLVQRRGKDLIRTHQPVGDVASLTLHNKILGKYAQHVSEHKLLHTTGSRLAECLTGTADPLSLLFQDEQARALMTDVYSNAPMFKAATMHLASYLKNLLLQHVSVCHRVIKVLEIGAGTGGTTDYLITQLAAVPGLNFQYTFTDLSSSLVTLARKRFKAHGFMSYMTMDIERDPPQELLGQYDIILSSNCIHATHNLVSSCANIRKLLRPKGILCLIELTRNLFWFDLVFGLLEGWWLFNDGRSHALADERRWDHSLRQAGLNWVDWTENGLEESQILRLIVASPAQPAGALIPSPTADAVLVRAEKVVYAEKDGLQLCADIYYPSTPDNEGKQRPVAILLHGGGHIMLSRKDICLAQVHTLLDMGFLPVAIDYRLCPEVSLLDGPMQDAAEALAWARSGLPQLNLRRPDITPDGTNVVAVGWSSGGHLAMTLAWTASARGIQAPEAILSFYSATDYTDPFWRKPNFPYKGNVSPSSDNQTNHPLDALHDTPLTSYNPQPDRRALGGWMSPNDPCSRIALHMNWACQTLPVLLHGWKYKSLAAGKNSNNKVILPNPEPAEIQTICPLSQAKAGRYHTPTFIIHGALDDLIPVEQARRTHEVMRNNGVECELRVVEGALHLFDHEPGFAENQKAVEAVADGYEFLRGHVDI
ncbi:hypothetical protein BJX63DRAFT_438016 [Aspergillus granulosus]|uniref:Uncharacterized protein n=1 Tax=Aspergillus granulosus TaxID=176169 RepID=A0ABR4GT91_9EURO